MTDSETRSKYVRNQQRRCLPRAYAARSVVSTYILGRYRMAVGKFQIRDDEIARKPLEDENGGLRKLVADPSLDREVLQDVIRRKL